MNQAASALLTALPRGRDRALASDALSERIGVHPRTLQSLVNELIEAGHPVGSACGEHPGFFLMCDWEDFIAGTTHFRRRAESTFRRYRRLRQMAFERFGNQTAQLFEVG